MSKIEFKTKIIKISHVSLLTSFFLGFLFFTGLVQLKAYAQSIDEVIVTARQQSESILDVPATVQTFSSEEIENAAKWVFCWIWHIFSAVK